MIEQCACGKKKADSGGSEIYVVTRGARFRATAHAGPTVTRDVQGEKLKVTPSATGNADSDR